MAPRRNATSIGEIFTIVGAVIAHAPSKGTNVMATDITKITSSRKAERDATGNPEARQALALEQIADELTALRADINGLIAFLGMTLKQRQP